MKKLILLLILMATITNLALAAVTVSNVRADQVADTDTVEIHYDLDFLGDSVTVALEIKEGTDAVSSASATGHIGSGITKGTNRKITWNAAVDWGDWNGTTNMSFLITATSYDPLLQLDKLSINFGEVLVGQSKSINVLVSNPGGGDLHVSNITVPDGFSLNWMSATIASESSKQLQVTFQPTEWIAYSGDLSIYSDMTGGTATCTVSGIGGISTTRPLGGDLTAIGWFQVNSRWVRNIYADGAITMSDQNTGLIWVYDADANGYAEWDAAKSRCSGLIYAGYDDWFLPNIYQIQAMYSQKGVFKDVKEAFYWSSTFDTPDSDYRWLVDMRNGTAYNVYYWTFVGRVWPCRSGQ